MYLSFFFCDPVTLFLRLLLVRYTCALPAHFPFSSYINIPNSSSEVDPKLDMYGIINVLYLKADKDMNGMISEPELADVYHGFDTNGQICLHLSSGYVHGLFISRYLNQVVCSMCYCCDRNIFRNPERIIK